MPIPDVNLCDGVIIDVIVNKLNEPVKTVVDFSKFVYLQLPHAQLLWRVLDRAPLAEMVKRHGTTYLYEVWTKVSIPPSDLLPAKLADPAGVLVLDSSTKDAVLQLFYKAVESTPVPWPELDDFVFYKDKVLKVRQLRGTCVLFTSNGGKTWVKVGRSNKQNEMTHAVNTMISAAELFGPVDRSKTQLTIKFIGSTKTPVGLLASATEALKVIDDKLVQDNCVLVHVKYLV